MAAKKRTTKRRAAKKTGRIRTTKKKRGRNKTPPDALKKLRAVTVGANENVWNLESALRKKHYFARVIRPNKLITTAPKSAE